MDDDHSAETFEFLSELNAGPGPFLSELTVGLPLPHSISTRKTEKKSRHSINAYLKQQFVAGEWGRGVVDWLRYVWTSLSVRVC